MLFFGPLPRHVQRHTIEDFESIKMQATLLHAKHIEPPLAYTYYLCPSAINKMALSPAAYQRVIALGILKSRSRTNIRDTRIMLGQNLFRIRPTCLDRNNPDLVIQGDT